MMESVKPPAVEDCPSPLSHESYQDVVVSGVVGIVVVGGNVVVIVVVVVVVVVAVAVVVDLNLINLCCRRRRMRAILSRLFLSALMREFGEYTLLPSTTRLPLASTAAYCVLVLL